jgi:hypothetical protein
VIDSIFQSTDQVISAELQDSANLLVILGSQQTEMSYLANHFDRLCDAATGQGDSKAAKEFSGGKDAAMTDEQQSGEARSISTKATANLLDSKTLSTTSDGAPIGCIQLYSPGPLQTCIRY